MKKGLVWFRRDLRLDDHSALFHALNECDEVNLVFCFDSNILSKLAPDDRRVTFIRESLEEMQKTLAAFKHDLIILQGDPKIEIPKLCEKLKITDLYFNKDYEPYAKKRDEFVAKKIKCHSFKDHVFFEKHEVLTKSRTLFKVFTPYKNEWIETFLRQDKIINEFTCELKKLKVYKSKETIQLDFVTTDNVLSGGRSHALKRLKKFKNKISDYQATRDFPELEGTSLLSPYIRFGNVSIREMIKTAIDEGGIKNNIWLSEIIWRDFYQMILDAHPYVEKSAFKKEYDGLKWPNDQKRFKAWCEGKTGFPIVDASIRCLNQTGLMHNRLRMIVASFLCKTLLVDYRYGEEYFSKQLLDFDLAANNGGWQWSASTGCDAQPYFRIFSPYLQSEKFDPEAKFIKTYCPELKKYSAKDIHRMNFSSEDYPPAIVNYSLEREKVLSLFKSIK